MNMRKRVVDYKHESDYFSLIVKWVVMAFFAILPILYFGKDIMNAGNTPARILFMFFFVVILYLCGQKIAKTRALRLPGKLTMPLVALLLVIFASAVFSPLRGQVIHTQIWSEDMLLSQWMAGIFMLFCLYQLLDTDELVHSTIIAVAIGGGAAAVIGLLDFFVFKSLGDLSDSRLTGTFFNPMFAGNYLLICIPFAICAANITRKYLYYVITALLTIAVIFTHARAAWVAMFVYAIYLAIYFAMKNRRMAIITVTGIAIAAGLIFIIPQTRGRVTGLITGDNTTRARIIYMHTAWKEFIARPILGWGVDTAQQISPQFRPLSNYSESNKGARRIMLDEDHAESLPHNIVLLILAEFGVIGLVVLSWLKLTIIGVVRKNGGMQDTVIFAAVGALITWGIANLFSYDNTAITCLPWLAITLIALRNKDIHMLAVPVLAHRAIYAASIILLIVTFIALSSNSKINRVIKDTAELKNMNNANTTHSFLLASDTLSLLQNIPMPDNAVYIRTLDLLNIQYETAPDEGSREGMRVKLLAAIDEGLNTYYRDWQLLRNGVILNFRFGNPEKALDYINALKKFEPNSAQVRVLEAEALMMEGNLGGAEKSVQEALRIAPSSPGPYLEAGKLYFSLFKGGDARGRKLLQMSEDAYRRGATIDITAVRPSAIIDFCAVLVINKKYDDVVTYGKYLRGNDRYYASLRGVITEMLAKSASNDKREEILRKLDE